MAASGQAVEIVTRSEAETEAAGTRLAQEIGHRAGTMIHLFGDLGAGKTAFVRGLAAGLALDPDEVSSPTFTLIQEYRPVAGADAGKASSASSGSASDSDSSASDSSGGVSSASTHVSLFHVDLYRLTGEEVPDLELDALAAEGVVAIEWADRLPAADPRAIIVRITDAGGDERRLRIERPSA
jgi:tRNA threonylcarbamoyladenosine biosynthesis protein TsaE